MSVKVFDSEITYKNGDRLDIGYLWSPTDPSLPKIASPLKHSDAPADGFKITGLFWEPRPGHMHGGIDIGVYKKDILAVTDGTIYSVQNLNNQAGGRWIWVKNDALDVMFIYFHLHSIAINGFTNRRLRVGDNVVAGQILGKTGNSNGSEEGGAWHLHFEVRKGQSNKKISPYPFLVDKSVDLRTIEREIKEISKIK